MLRNSALRLAALAAVFVPFAAASGAVWRVPGDGNEVANVIDTIAAPGDTVQVIGNGGATFHTRVVIDKDLTLQGGWRADFQVRDPSIYVTVLRDIEDEFINQRPIIRIDGTPRVVIDGLTIIGGRFGVRADDGADVVIRDCTMRNQLNITVASEGFRLSGGGVRIVGGRLLMENSRIRNVVALIHGAGMALLDVTDATIVDTTIRNCRAQFASGFDQAEGGGIYAVNCGSLSLTRCTLDNNTTLNRGGHVFLQNTPVTLTECTFDRGASALGGGAIHSEDATTLSVSDSDFSFCVGAVGGAVRAVRCGDVSLVNARFAGNLARDEGGALTLEQCGFAIRDSEFEANNPPPPSSVISVRGGAVRCLDSFGTVTNTTFRNEKSIGRGGAWSQVGGNVLFRQCIFEDNESLTGGAAQIELAGTSRFEECLFRANTGKFGGALAAAFAAVIEADHVTITAGGADNAGAALYLETSAQATLSSSILCCATEGELVACSAAAFTMSHCDVWNDDAVNAQAEFSAACGNPIGTNGNISADPMFCDPGVGDYGLTPGSPCAGAGGGGSDIGWAPVGCPASAALSVVPDTWGAIKGRYRAGTDVSRTLD